MGNLLVSMITPVALISAVAWLARNIISQYLSKDIEKYKSDLKHESDLKIEELRTSLKITAFEHEIRFSRLHDKRAFVIAEMHEKLVEAKVAATNYISFVDLPGEPNKKEKLQIASTKFMEFYQYFEKQKLYLSKPLCGEIIKFAEKLWQLSHKLSLTMPDLGFAQQPDGEYKDVWMEAWGSVSHDVPRALESLEDEFRILLGVDRFKENQHE
jgi:hypothetical protein